MSLIKKIVKMTSIKYRQDKGRQERAMCLILASIFGPNLTNQNEKLLFNSLLKRIFDFEATSFIEEMLTGLIKDQMAEDGLKNNNKQIQKVFFLFECLKEIIYTQV